MTKNERLLRITLLEEMVLEHEQNSASNNRCIEKIALLNEFIEKEAQAMRFEKED